MNVCQRHNFTLQNIILYRNIFHHDARFRFPVLGLTVTLYAPLQVSFLPNFADGSTKASDHVLLVLCIAKLCIICSSECRRHLVLWCAFLLLSQLSVVVPIYSMTYASSFRGQTKIMLNPQATSYISHFLLHDINLYNHLAA